MANGFLRGDGAGNVTADKPVYIVPIRLEYISGSARRTATITSDDTYADLYEKLTAGYQVMLQEKTTGSRQVWPTGSQTTQDFDWYVCDGYFRYEHNTSHEVQYGFSFHCLAGDDLIRLSTELSSTAEDNAEQNTFAVSRQRFMNPSMTWETLPAVDWSSSDNSQVLEVSGVDSSEGTQVIIVSPATDSQSAYYAAGVRCVGQDTDQLTFQCDTIPDVDLDVFVSIQEVQ